MIRPSRQIHVKIRAIRSNDTPVVSRSARRKESQGNAHSFAIHSQPRQECRGSRHPAQAIEAKRDAEAAKLKTFLKELGYE